MRLKSLSIGRYKNLRNFNLNFEGDSFIDLFIGKNGSGKSNLFEALSEVLRHLYEYDREKIESKFDYTISYEINGVTTEITWEADRLIINGRTRATIGETLLPDNVLIYYSGHNDIVASLVSDYEETFRKRIKNAEFDESRRFIAIGPEYKSLLLAVLLMQRPDNKAQQFICKKLDIKTLGITKPGGRGITQPVVKLELKRPLYAKGTNYDIINNDDSDRYWKPAGITKVFLERLTNCVSQEPSSMALAEGYFSADDRYTLYFDIAKIQQEFVDFSAQEFFRQLDNLKTLGMLADITIPLQLRSGLDASIANFSDGQFQSVYIYSIVELFKDRNCLTLLDEPDSFLHPEWQFEFLKQVLEITDTTAKQNHVLMSTHSASTITTANEDVINLFEFQDDKIVVRKANKADIIKSLSAGLISFSESEARLNIHHALKNTTGAVLFTEGITDEMILETAWAKLFPTQKRSFEIQNAFDRIFLRNLFSRDELGRNFPDRIMFALFDFDEAFDDWNGLKKESDSVTDPYKGLSKQLKCKHHYAMLLPVPDIEVLKRQVLDSNGKPWGKGADSHLSIELLFYKDELLGQWFHKKATSGGGEIIEFIGDKVSFAKNFVPTLDAACFEPFKLVFEYIQSICNTQPSN
ncbi:AAA family ATPase [Pseudomonas wadenswilerensis]|uniref:AAA family ATPase n=1 Tax=Pseudomonas wadenswilerensis TaxID=1785161 RepID=UPI00320AD3A0